MSAIDRSAGADRRISRVARLARRVDADLLRLPSRIRRAWTPLLGGALVLLARSDAAAQGCAMCRTALGSADDPLARGFYWSVLLLISAPYAVFGSIAGGLVYRHVPASRGAAAPGEPGVSPE